MLKCLGKAFASELGSKFLFDSAHNAGDRFEVNKVLRSHTGLWFSCIYLGAPGREGCVHCLKTSHHPFLFLSLFSPLSSALSRMGYLPRRVYIPASHSLFFGCSFRYPAVSRCGGLLREPPESALSKECFSQPLCKHHQSWEVDYSVWVCHVYLVLSILHPSRRMGHFGNLCLSD